MKIVVSTTQVPFIHGGAEVLVGGLEAALVRAGHEVAVVTHPFRFEPIGAVRRSMRQWQEENFEQLGGHAVDRLIALKFPAYYARHPQKVVWLLHQHRTVYELWGTAYDGDLSKNPEGPALRDEIRELDSKALGECRGVYSISRRVSDRLSEHNGIESTPIYHPPHLADSFYTARSEPYIFCPSRFEGLKRQLLLVEAMAHVRSPVVALLAGDGGMRDRLEQRIAELGLERRVRLLGFLDETEMLAYYAHATAVFFGPYDEDYGYVTLEASLASKPTITCSDSGGPLEFVHSGRTGLIAEPNEKAVADAIDSVCGDAMRAVRMGREAREAYLALGITWDGVVESLLQ